MIRVLLVGLFTFVGVLFSSVAFFHYFPNELGASWMKLTVFSLAVLVLTLAPVYLFVFRGQKPVAAYKSQAEMMAELTSQGLVVS